MKRFLIIASLAASMAFIPTAEAKKPEGNNGPGGTNGYIQSLSNTMFSVGLGRRRRGSEAVVVHYNPETTVVMVDGQRVQFLDISDIGKYVSVAGEMKDNQLEAASITVTTSDPNGQKKSKSKN